MSRKQAVSLYGFGMACDDGEVERECHVHLLEDGTYFVKLVTNWSGAAAPAVTVFGLSPEAFNLLQEAMNTAAHRMHLWPMPVEPEFGAA
jgi:hypothetical protein